MGDDGLLPADEGEVGDRALERLAASACLESCTASPTPMLRVILRSLGTCITLEYSNRSTSSPTTVSR